MLFKQKINHFPLLTYAFHIASGVLAANLLNDFMKLLKQIIDKSAADQVTEYSFSLE